MEKKYNDGEVVIDRIRPNQKLVINSYSNKIYYCTPQEERTQKQLVYFERELKTHAGTSNNH